VIENDGDKLNPRWLKGAFVGKIDGTDEFVFLTPRGVKKSRSIKRLEGNDAWDREFLAGCLGAPWNPTGRPSTTVQSGTALNPGNKMRRMYITTKILSQYGRTDGCEACETHKGPHSQRCRERLEKLMIDAGDAFQASVGDRQIADDGKDRRAADDGEEQEAQSRKRARDDAAGEQPPSKDADGDTNMSIAGIVAAIRNKIDEPYVDLTRERWALSKFPADELQKGRSLEVENLIKFDTFEELEEYEGKSYDMIWVDEWRGDKVRSRLVVRQFNTESNREDLFAATPDTFFMRFVLAYAAADPRRAIIVIDISVAFMHARSDEEIVVRVPRDIKGTSKFWKLKAAINGTRKASQLWQEHSAAHLMEMGFRRNDVNPCIFWHPEYDFHMEQHGDDFLGTGMREHTFVIKDWFEAAFCCKKVEIISNHKADLKATSFLKRDITVDDTGYHLEMDPRYSESLVRRCGLESAKGAPTPAPKVSDKDPGDLLDRAGQKHFRGGAGVAQYMAEHRPDIAYATKEVLRDGSAPGVNSVGRLKRIGRYIKINPRAVLDFPWNELGDSVTATVDADWAGDPKTRCSTSGGVIRLGSSLLKHWTTTQPTVSLSSGESEMKAITKGCVELLYIDNLLKQQGLNMKLFLETDASAAKGAAARLGSGKRMKHLDVQDLWVQQVVKSGRIKVTKISTVDNVADFLTKPLELRAIMKAMKDLNYRFIDDGEYRDEEVENNEATPDHSEEDRELGALLGKLSEHAQ
jgi:hypothetical protein